MILFTHSIPIYDKHLLLQEVAIKNEVTKFHCIKN